MERLRDGPGGHSIHGCLAAGSLDTSKLAARGLLMRSPEMGSRTSSAQYPRVIDVLA